MSKVEVIKLYLLILPLALLKVTDFGMKLKCHEQLYVLVDDENFRVGRFRWGFPLRAGS